MQSGLFFSSNRHKFLLSLTLTLTLTLTITLTITITQRESQKVVWSSNFCDKVAVFLPPLVLLFHLSQDGVLYLAHRRRGVIQIIISSKLMISEGNECYIRV